MHISSQWKGSRLACRIIAVWQNNWASGVFYQMRSGAHFMNDFSIVIQIWWKLHCALIQIIAKWVTTKLCTLYDSCAAIACAKFCSNIISYNGVTKKKFPLNFNYGGKIVHEKALLYPWIHYLLLTFCPMEDEDILTLYGYRQPAGHACFAQASLILSFGVVCYKEVTFALRICESSWCHFWLTYLNISLTFSINVVAMRENMFLTYSECNFGQIWTIIDGLVTW